MHTKTLLERLRQWQRKVMADYDAGCIIRLDDEKHPAPQETLSDPEQATGDSQNTRGYPRNTLEGLDAIHSHYPPPFLQTNTDEQTREHETPGANSVPPSPYEDYLGNRKRPLGYLPRVRAIVVGFDARGYSKRRDPEQVFLTLALHAATTRALVLLRNLGILPADEPRIVLERGDGALLTFTFLDALDLDHVFLPSSPSGHRKARTLRNEKEKRQSRHLPVVVSRAFSFIFALNAVLTQANRRMGFLSGSTAPTSPRHPQDPMQTLPLELRFAVSYDDILLLEDINQCLNGAGRGLVACGRILGSDHGGHFLVQQSLLDALLPSGGLDRICDGAWEHQLHRAALPQTTLKSDSFAYSDLFGFHYDRPLLAALGRQDLKPEKYHIGSHDTGIIDR